MSFPRYSEYIDSGVRWLGEMPAHWALQRYKQVFSEREERSDSGLETLLSVSAYTGVSPRSEIVDDGDHLSRAESLEGYKVCYPNDLVVNIMLAWNRGLGFSEHHGIVSPAYSVFVPRAGNVPRFLDYMVRSDQVILYYKAFSSGVIDSRLRLYPDTFGSLYCMLPPPVEQAAIAAFLDRETAKIDALIAEKEKLIALLAEKRQATISRAVTCGIDPDVPTKDSGVAWLGQVPSHWQVVPLMHLTEASRPIMYGIVLPGPDVEDGIPILKGGDVKPHRLKLDLLNRTTPEIEAPYARARLRGGDIVYSIRGTIGEAELVPIELEGANITQDVARVAPALGVSADWLLQALKSDPVFVQLEQRSLGAAVRGINIFELKRARIPVPPPSEQARIAAYLEAEARKLDDLRRGAQRSIALLRERRSALITAAVTGQIDVRNAVPA